MEVELDTITGTDDPLELGNLNKLDVVDMLAGELSATDKLSANAELDIMKELELVPVCNYHSSPYPTTQSVLSHGLFQVASLRPGGIVNSDASSPCGI